MRVVFQVVAVVALLQGQKNGVSGLDAHGEVVSATRERNLRGDAENGNRRLSYGEYGGYGQVPSYQGRNNEGTQYYYGQPQAGRYNEAEPAARGRYNENQEVYNLAQSKSNGSGHQYYDGQSQVGRYNEAEPAALGQQQQRVQLTGRYNEYQHLEATTPGRYSEVQSGRYNEVPPATTLGRYNEVPPARVADAHELPGRYNEAHQVRIAEARKAPQLPGRYGETQTHQSFARRNEPDEYRVEEAREAPMKGRYGQAGRQNGAQVGRYNEPAAVGSYGEYQPYQQRQYHEQVSGRYGEGAYTGAQRGRYNEPMVTERYGEQPSGYNEYQQQQQYGYAGRYNSQYDSSAAKRACLDCEEQFGYDKCATEYGVC